MTAYIIRRILQSLLVLIIVTIIIFLAVRFLPGDPILMYISPEELSVAGEEKIAALKYEFGLDKPVPLQYINWFSGIFRGDLGKSMKYRVNVMDEISRRLPITLYLGLIAFVISAIIGIPIGIISALRRGKWIDILVTSLANIGIAVPVFWLGVLMVYFFGLQLRWLPIFGFTSPTQDFWLSLRQTIMPVICLSLFSIASSARQTRSSMLEVIRQDYIRTAWSKGLSERTVVIFHALKNGLIPIVTLKGMHLRSIVGGSVLVETVFSIPGMGRLAVEGLLAHDFAIVQGVALIIALIVLLSNLLVDLSYGWLDPRIRYQ